MTNFESNLAVHLFHSTVNNDCWPAKYGGIILLLYQ